MFDVMLDLETFGKKTGCVIRSIGAIVFDPYSDRTGETFYQNVTKEDQVALGLHVDPETEAWWARQPTAARDALVGNQVSAEEAAKEFVGWWKKQNVTRVWSQGANFDEPIISEFFRVLKRSAPWKFHDSRDTRTAYQMGDFNVFAVKRKGTHHNALEDSRHQAYCVQQAFKKLGLHKEIL